MKIYCTHHSEHGICTEEDFNDAKTGINPSGMVRVKFNLFTQAVPFHTLLTEEDLKNESDLNSLENQSNEC